MDWSLICSQCPGSDEATGLKTVCPACGSPFLVRYARRIGTRADAKLGARGHTMWRYREFLPLAPGEEPVSIGEGGTPLLRARRLADRLGVSNLWIKDE